MSRRRFAHDAWRDIAVGALGLLCTVGAAHVVWSACARGASSNPGTVVLSNLTASEVRLRVRVGREASDAIALAPHATKTVPMPAIREDSSLRVDLIDDEDGRNCGYVDASKTWNAAVSVRAPRAYDVICSTY